MAYSKLLIVDDDIRICRLIQRVAMNLGFQPLVVDDSDQFVPTYIEHEPSVIVLDLKMKGLDGVELLRYLSTLDSSAAVIMMSGVEARILETTVRLGRSLGLNIVGSLSKPLEIDELKYMLGQQFQSLSRHDSEQPPVSEDELSHAIEHNHLEVYYQPQIDLATSRILGVEALCRWQHKERGFVPPDEFIPLAERTGLIKPLTERVLERSILDNQQLRAYLPNVETSVNLSACLLGDLTLPDDIEKLLEKHDVGHHRLVIEVTESAAMEDPSRTMDILARLRLKDIRISIDDFGTGYSSLVQLYRLPFSELKVDKSFVMEMGSSDEADAIVRSTIQLAHSLGLKVVAEGVEERSVLDRLRTLSCDVAQGYFISRPLPLSSLMEWVSERRKTA